MAFLSKDELKTNASVELLEIIAKQDDTTISTIIEGWIDEMKTHMTQYDVETIFSAEGEDRSKVVLKNLKALVTYDIFQLGDSDFGEKKHDDAVVWLEKVARGMAKLDLPAALTEDSATETTTDPLYGGTDPYETDF